MAEYQFTAFTETIYDFTLEAEDEEAALDMARAYLDIQTIKHIRNKDIELLEASLSIESVESVTLATESGTEKDVTAELLTGGQKKTYLP